MSLSFTRLHEVPYHVHLEHPPAGVAAAAGRNGEDIPIAYREFTSSEDGDTFISRLEGLPATILALLDADPPIKPSTVDHLVAVIRPNGDADVYINELAILGKARIRKAVQHGDLLLDGDIVDIEELRFKDLEIPSDAGVLILLSQGWRKGLFFDFGPILPNPVQRNFDLSKLLGSLFSYLTFQQYFKITDEDWQVLFKAGWFPFVGIERETLNLLITYIRNSWDPDDIISEVATKIKSRLDEIQGSWRTQALLAPHIDILSRALERFREDDYISATAILYPRIEGLLRDLHAKSGGTSFKQTFLAQAPLTAIADRAHQFSRILPTRFRTFLETVYFASFSPSAVPSLSRHSVAHGVAPAELFSVKAATFGILIVEQICFHTPPAEGTPPVTA